MPNSNVYLEQLSGHKEVRFDLRKFSIIGSQEKNYMLLYMRADAPYKTIGDIIKAKEAPKCGSPGVGSAGYILDRVLDFVFGAKINTIMGYPGQSEIDLAVERRDPMQRQYGFATFRTRALLHLAQERIRPPLIQIARKRDPVVSEAPTMNELMDEYKTSESNRRVAQVLPAAPSLGALCWSLRAHPRTE